MIEKSLIYIRSGEPGNRFVGCGVLVEGGYVATCRHVWRMATKADADAPCSGEPAVPIEYPHFVTGGVTFRSPARLAEGCESADGPVPDLVLLRPESLPSGIMSLQLAAHDRFQVGAGYALAGLIGRDERNPSAVRDAKITGIIDDVMATDGRRQFSGSNAAGFWLQPGASGSPVFRDGGQQVAGILSLSVLGPGSPLEAFIVPATTIRSYVSALAAKAVATEKGIDPADLRPILETIGAPDLPIPEIPGRLKAFVEATLARANEPLRPSNDGADIEAVISASREKLETLDTAGARNLLQAKIDEEQESRARRLLPLLRERAAIERLAFDHEAAKTTYAEIVRLARDDVGAWIKLGELWQTTGSLARAEEAFGNALDVASRARDEGGMMAVSDRLGDVLSAQGRLDDALAAYRAGRAIVERLAAADPSNAGWQRDLSVSHNKLGDVLSAQGRLDDALAAYRAGRAIVERLAAADPSNAGWQRDLSVSHNKLGDVLSAQGRLDDALAAYRAGLAIRERLGTPDPSNAGWQRDLSVSHNRLGDVLSAQGRLDDALAAYRAGLTIAERLAAADPSNAGWQRDLSVSHNKQGDVLRAQGRLDDALAAYRAGRAIAEWLAAADPSNAGWQHDLAVSQERLGDVLSAQGRLDDALAAYRAGRAIVERLAAADPSNAGWQRDLSVSHNKLGDVLRAQGRLDDALAAYRAGCAIVERLAAADPSNAGWQRDLSVSHNRLGDVLSAQGRLDDALAAYRADLTIAERLAAADPSNAGWQRDLSVSHNKQGDVLRAQGRLDDALAAYNAGRAIVERLAAADPSNAGWQRDLIVSYAKVSETNPADAKILLPLALGVARNLETSGRLAPTDAWIPGDLARRIAELKT